MQKGTITGIQAAESKNGKQYQKVQIESDEGIKTLNCWDDKLTTGFNLGDNVEYDFGQKKAGDVTYYNLTSMQHIETSVEEVKDASPKSGKETLQDYKSKEADKFELGMAKNNAATIIAAVIQQGEIKKEDILPNYIALVKKLYAQGKELRQEILAQ